jgi:UDP-N-acetylmuramate dehydrogenase
LEYWRRIPVGEILTWKCSPRHQQQIVISQYIEGEFMTQPDIEIRENIPLAPPTTLGVGGNARFLAKASSVAGVERAVTFASDRGLELFVLGGGSNLVVSDRGFDGLVVQIAVEGVEESRSGDQVRFDVGAGVGWDVLVALSVARGCGGAECLSGIPGSAGGTPVQNVGAYGEEVSETIVSVLAYDLMERRVRELTKSECGFAYRSSIFNSSQRGRYVILRVTYELNPGAEPKLGYADLQKYFAGRSEKPTLAEVRAAVLEIRAAKGMVIIPGDPDSRSAGSFFKNPVLSAEEFAQLSKTAAERGMRVPSYPALAQQSKVSAAWLVENSGFHKGYQKGAVAISSKHALAIVNRGGATAAEVIALRDEIQAKVELMWGVKLQTEPVFVGF